MLALSLRPQEQVVIGEGEDKIVLRLGKDERHAVRVSFDGPRSVPVYRMKNSEYTPS